MKLASMLLVAAAMAPAAALAQVSNPALNINTANLTAPAVGQTVTDPNFGVTVRRLTDRGSNGGLATVEYPQLQSVNADETRILVATDQGYSILDIATLAFTHSFPDISYPRWDPTDPDAVIGYNQRTGNILLQRHELMPNGMIVVSTLVDIDALGFTSISVGSYEDLSDDGRYVGVIGDRNGTTTAAVLDIATGTIRSSVAVSNVDWISISPSGNYLVVQNIPRGTGNAEGLVVYDAATGASLGHATDHHDHGDLGRDANGDDMFTTLAYTDYCANGNIGCCSSSPLPDAIESLTINNLYEVGAGTYTSCRAHQRPGFCLHADDTHAPGTTPFAAEVWLTRISDGAVLRLMHHRSSSCSYFNTTRPTVSPTGRYVLFTSDWASPNCSDQGDVYLIDTLPFLDNFLNSVVPPVDAGFPDTGVPPFDSGVVVDGGFVDMGFADIGFTDGGFDEAGFPVDVGFPDTGASDAALDAGVSDTARRDGSGGSRGLTNDRELRGGCGCNASQEAPSSATAILLLGFALARRRR